MPRSPVRLSRTVPSLAIAAVLAFGAHAAFASPATISCSYDGNGRIGLSCWPGTSGDSWCNYQCERRYGPDSFGECTAFGEQQGCCLCAT